MHAFEEFFSGTLTDLCNIKVLVRVTNGICLTVGS